MGKELDLLAQAVDELLAVDAAALHSRVLHDQVVGVERLAQRLTAAAGRLVGEWDRRRVWADNGALTAAARLASEAHVSPRVAEVELRRARQLAHMPAVAEAFAAGRLSTAHVDLLARVRPPHRAEIFAVHEPVLVELCARHRFAKAERAIAKWELLVDSAGVEAGGQAQAEAARVFCSTTYGGMTRVDGWLDPVGGEVVGNELRRLAEEQRLADRRCGRRRSAAQRRAAALVQMAARSAGSTGGGRRPLFTVAIGQDEFTGMCQLGSGTPVAPGLLLPWLSAADVQAVLFTGGWRAVSVSHRRRFCEALRLVIALRDGHCQHPSGCDIPASECDLDHIDPYHRSRRTSQGNGRLACPTHNRVADKRDHPPPPTVPVTVLEHLRAHLRHRYLHPRTDCHCSGIPTTSDDDEDDENDGLDPL